MLFNLTGRTPVAGTRWFGPDWRLSVRKASDLGLFAGAGEVASIEFCLEELAGTDHWNYLEGSPEVFTMNARVLWENRVTAPRRHFNDPRSGTTSGPLKARRLYREFVTAMVVETLRLFCGLSNKELQNKLVGDCD